MVPSRPIGTIASTLAALGLLGPVRAQEPGEVHEVRTDRIDLDIAPDDLLSDVADQHVGCCPCRRIERCSRGWAGTGGAREHQDLAATALDHCRHDAPEELVGRLDTADQRVA